MLLLKAPREAFTGGARVRWGRAAGLAFALALICLIIWSAGVFAG